MAEPSVFISYRRSDTGGHAGRLYDALIRRFGRDQVFMDTGSIRPGQDWASVLAAEVERCDVLLVLIGPDWATVRDITGSSRLADESDPLRLEVEAGLASGKPLIPVLLGGADMPQSEALPESLRALTSRQAISITNDSYADGVRALAGAIRGVPTAAGPAKATRTRESAADSVTLTFLFTDIAGSTQLLQQIGEERSRDLFEKHHGQLRKAIADNGGSELEWLGDGVLASFGSSADAIKCAMAMQRASAKPLAGHVIGLRVGVHTGEAMRRDGGYFGNAVVIARRLCDTAQPGQVLTSGVVVSMLAGRPLRFRPQGKIELKGIAQPVDVFAVESSSAAGTAEPVAVAPAAASKPAQASVESRPASPWRNPVVIGLAALAGLLIVAVGVAFALSSNQPTGAAPVIGGGSGLVTFSVVDSGCNSRSCYIDVLQAVTDPDGDPLHLVSAGPSSAGNVVNRATNGGAEVVYWSAQPAFSATTDTFEFTVSDNHHNQVSGTCTVTQIPAP